MQIHKILKQICFLPDSSAEKIISHITETGFSKNHILMRAGRVEKKIYFIKKGIVRAYANGGDQEVTFWFGKEGEAIVSMNSYVANKPGYENIELLEDCQLYEIAATQLQQLYEEDLHIANWGRKLAEQELIKTEARLIAQQFQTALQRYQELLAKDADLLQRVQLGYIASYLGITQVSLSRIRAEIR